MKQLLIAHRVWDLVSGKRVRPNAAPEPVGTLGAPPTNQTEIEAANTKMDEFEDACNKAACLISESISDAEILFVASVLEDPVATWDKLQQKFARRSEMGQQTAQMALLHFQHMETETADDTIARFEALVEKCVQQGVQFDDQLLERMILQLPNERYTYLKKSYQHSKMKQDLQEIFCSMRDDDAEYQISHTTPPPGSAAFAEAVNAKAELLWAQRSKDSSRPSGSRPAASHTICYCCGEKGHYAKDCKHSTSVCTYCSRVGHLEQACRQKKQREEGGPRGEASFFHGDGYSAVVELTSCDFHHDLSVSLPSVPSALQDDEEMCGEAMAVGAEKSSTFLGDTGASHHIVCKREYFSELSPLPRPFRINQVQGSVAVTHWGTVVLEVDGDNGKQPFWLMEVLLIESMDFNILSLQKLRAAGYIPVYDKVEGKVVINKEVHTGGVTQVALLSETKQGRLTLDCMIVYNPTTIPLLPHAKALIHSLSMDLAGPVTPSSLFANEPLLFPAAPPPPAAADAAADAAAAGPVPVAPLVLAVQPLPAPPPPGAADAAADAAAVADAAGPAAVAPLVLAAQPLPTPIPAPPQVPGPKRSRREYRGVPPVRMADMLMAAQLEGSDKGPKTYKNAMLLPDAADDEEPFVFPAAPAPPAGPNISEFKIINGPPEDGAPPDDASSQPPTAAAGTVVPAPAHPADSAAAIQPLLAVHPLPAVQSLPAQNPAPPQVPEPMGSTRENRGISLVRLTMLLADSLEKGEAEPKTYKQATELPDAAHRVEASTAAVASMVGNVYEVERKSHAYQMGTSSCCKIPRGGPSPVPGRKHSSGENSAASGLDN